MKIALLIALCVAATACASTPERGWTGHGAEPFDAAESACRIATVNVDTAMREHEFATCMAERGWRRP